MPTCTEAGSKSRSCTKCKRVIDVEEIPATGHDETDWLTQTAVTCTSNGVEYKECYTCGEVTQTRVVESQGHKYSDWQVAVPVTCESDGSEKKVCVECGDVVTRDVISTGHHYSEWQTVQKLTCETDGVEHMVCSGCNDEITRTTPATGHDYGEWCLCEEATCTEEGSEYRICKKCMSRLWRSIPTSHKSSGWIVDRKATVNKAGSKHKECTECGKKLKTAEIAQLKCSKPAIKSAKNTATGVNITWGKVSGADSYKVYRKVSGGSYNYIGKTTGTSYTDKTAKNNTKYYYVVKAVNEAGASEKSASKGILFVATPKLVSASSSKSGVTVKWGKVSKADGYIVYRKTGSGDWVKIAKVSGGSKVSYVDKTAKKGVTYKYTVCAYDGSTKSGYNTSGLKIKDKY
jgi:hypothetical protein